MTKHFLVFFLMLSLMMPAISQDTLSGKMPGKWGICYSIDTLDTICKTPFNFYTFRADGTCQHGEIIIMGDTIPVTGTWKSENGSIRIVYDKHPNYIYPPETLPDIVFINDKLFYYKVLDNYEVKGHWVFFSFRKLD
ncbi:MAG: hypothetical protein IPP73_16645 [Chitinophagaceae bacterium]|nr:hypothetical protein [Chitinophagaceae bacterium]